MEVIKAQHKRWNDGDLNSHSHQSKLRGQIEGGLQFTEQTGRIGRISSLDTMFPGHEHMLSRMFSEKDAWFVCNSEKRV